MSKEVILSLVRSLLTAFASYFVGKHIFGQVIDPAQWEGWVALAVGVGSTIWGYVDKSTTLDSLQSLLRSAVIFIGGIFVAKGSITADQLTSISGIVLAIAPFLYSTLSKAKVVSLAKGKTVAMINGTVKKAA